MKRFCMFIRALFGCPHSRRTFVRSDRDGQYQMCVDCGQRLPYNRIDFSGAFYRERRDSRWEEISAWLKGEKRA
jgi:hypothetical protein